MQSPRTNHSSLEVRFLEDVSQNCASRSQWLMFSGLGDLAIGDDELTHRHLYSEHADNAVKGDKDNELTSAGEPFGSQCRSRCRLSCSDWPVRWKALLKLHCNPKLFNICETRTVEFKKQIAPLVNPESRVVKGETGHFDQLESPLSETDNKLYSFRRSTMSSIWIDSYARSDVPLRFCSYLAYTLAGTAQILAIGRAAEAFASS